MERLATWLEPYSRYLDPQTLLDTVSDMTEAEFDEEDPEAFLQNLMSPLDHMNLSTKYLTKLFTDQDQATEVTTTPEAAVEFCLEQIRASPTLPPASVATLGEAYLKLGHHRASEICSAAAYLAGDRSVTTLCLLAGMAIREDRSEEAREAEAAARAGHPDRPEPLYYGALIQLAHGAGKDAVRRSAELTTAHPGYRPGWSLLLDACLWEGLWDEAVRYGKRAVELDPLDPLLWERLAMAHRGAGAGSRALEFIRKARETAAGTVDLPAVVTLRLQLEEAAMEEEAGHPEAALQLYRSLLDGGHREAAVFANAASCFQGMRRAGEAEQLLRTGLQLHPDHPALLTNLGELLFQAERDPEAFESLQKAAENEPERTDNLLLMAAICLRNRQFDAAVELASSVLRRDPARATEALVLLGDAYRFQGAPAAALEAYREAWKMAPGDAAVQARVKEIERIVQVG